MSYPQGNRAAFFIMWYYISGIGSRDLKKKFAPCKVNFFSSVLVVFYEKYD